MPSSSGGLQGLAVLRALSWGCKGALSHWVPLLWAQPPRAMQELGGGRGSGGAGQEQDPGWGARGTGAGWTLGRRALGRAKEGHSAGGAPIPCPGHWASPRATSAGTRHCQLCLGAGRKDQCRSSVYALLCCLDSAPVSEILILHPIRFSYCNTLVIATMLFLGMEGKSERKPLSTLLCELLI